jgi:hypothetical protein
VRRQWDSLWEHPAFKRLCERLERDRQKMFDFWKTADFEATYARAMEQGDLQRIEWLLKREYENEDQEEA